MMEFDGNRKITNIVDNHELHIVRRNIRIETSPNSLSAQKNT